MSRSLELEISFELEHLRSFLVFAEELHFSRAASKLYISQSSLSRQVQSLEKSFKVKLVERTTRRVQLTAAGQLLADQINILLRDIAELKRAVFDVVEDEIANYHR